MSVIAFRISYVEVKQSFLDCSGSIEVSTPSIGSSGHWCELLLGNPFTEGLGVCWPEPAFRGAVVKTCLDPCDSVNLFGLAYWFRQVAWTRLLVLLICLGSLLVPLICLGSSAGSVNLTRLVC